MSRIMFPPAANGRISLHDAALSYAAANLAVFPLKPGGKTPITAHGFHDATTDPDQINRHWKRTPDANIGVRPYPGHAVIDTDVSDGKTGQDTLADLTVRLGRLVSPWIVETATGGTHIWVDLGDFDGRTPRATLGSHVDVKVGRTGYLVMPPSRRVVGGRERHYRWLFLDPSRAVPHGLPGKANASWRDAILRTDTPPPLDTPTPAAAPGRNPAYVVAAVSAELAALAAAREGTRNDTLFRVAATLYGFVKAGHAHRDQLDNELHRLAAAAGLPDTETSAVLRSAWERAEPRTVPAATFEDRADQKGTRP